MNTVQLLCLLIDTYLEINCTFIPGSVAITGKLDWKKYRKYLPCLLLLTVVELLFFLRFGHTSVSPIIFFFAFIFIYMLYFHIRLHTAFLAALISCITYQCFLNIVTLPYSFFLFPHYTHVEKNFIIGSIVLFSTFLIVLLICRLLPLQRLLRYLEQSHFVLQLLLFNICLCLVTFLLLSRTNFTNYWKNLIVINITIAILFMVNMEILFSHHSLEKRKQELAYYNTYMPVIEELISRIRISQHNHNNTIQALSGLPLTYTDYDGLKNALQNYTAEITHVLLPSSLLRLDNKLAAGLLYQKMCQAEQQHKTLQIDIRHTISHTSVTEFELVEYLGILLDNALEATPEHGVLFCTLGYQNNHMFIETLNPGPHLNDAMLKNIFKKGYSSKRNPSETASESSDIIYDADRGIGLWSLKKSIGKHHGTITVSNLEKNGLLYIRFLVELPAC